MQYTERELCAIVITKAMRNDVQPMVHFIQELRRQGYDDLDVGRLFTEVAMIIYGETWPEDEKQFCEHEYCAGQDYCVYSPDFIKNEETEQDETTTN